MSNMSMTKHAQTRAQQRQIPPMVIDWLFKYGAADYRRGFELLHFDKKSRDRIRRDAGRSVVNKLGSLLNAYVVVKDGSVITTGYRNKRIRNH